MRCKNCGTNSKGSFCTKCGAKMPNSKWRLIAKSCFTAFLVYFGIGFLVVTFLPMKNYPAVGRIISFVLFALNTWAIYLLWRKKKHASENNVAQNALYQNVPANSMQSNTGLTSEEAQPSTPTYIHSSDGKEISEKEIPHLKEVSLTAAHTQPKQDSPYSSFFPDPNKSIDEISEDARKHSEAMHQLHQKEFMEFDPFHLDTSLVDNKPFSAVEKSFLKYMSGNNVINPYIPGYWTYEYHINYKKLLTKFLVQGYLKISSDADTLPFLTVEELKAILRCNNLKVSGKKEELINRITDNIDSSVIESSIQNDNRKYILTEKGLQITSGMKASATKDTDLEDACLQCILSYRFDEAYKKICNNELSKNIPRGIVNWNEEVENGLPQAKTDYYTEVMTGDTIPFPEEISGEDRNTAKACVILGEMLGVSVDNIYKMFCRVTNKTYHNTIVIPFLQKLQFDLMGFMPKRTLGMTDDEYERPIASADDDDK